jgi:pyruvate/2-oxoglutarate dehydrogenase complex dihydrolipoamide acyltransferase (E2) component
MSTTIKMPQLGESVTEGTIERWLVKEGDRVEQYDPLFEVVTDKVNAEVPAEVAGTVTKIIVGDGETVKVGTPLAEISAEGEAAGEPAAGGDGQAAAPTATEAAPAQGAEAQAVATPAQAETPAQPAAAPEPETQEAPTEPSPSAPAEQQPATATAQAPAPDAVAGGQAAAAPDTTRAAEPSIPSGDGAARMTPAVRRLVREHNVDISQIRGSGAGGRVTRDDVLAFVAQRGEAPAAAPAPAEQPAAAQQPAPAAAPQPAPAPQAAPEPAAAQVAAPAAPTPAPAPAAAQPYRPPAPVTAPAGQDVEMPLSQMRKGIAAKMTKVKQTVPHAYTMVEVDMTGVVNWRERQNQAYRAREGSSLSYVAVVVKAATDVLRRHPTVNAQFAEDKIVLKQRLNIGIAVAIDNGLIVPVIHDADQLSIHGVNQRIRDLSARAHSNRLRLEELQGGTFTVNNTGWFGSVASMPIINAPEVAILSMEAIVKRPRVIEVDGQDVIAVRHMMNMTCSFDHRVLDGAQVGQFMADLRSRLESWSADTPVT